MKRIGTIPAKDKQAVLEQLNEMVKTGAAKKVVIKGETFYVVSQTGKT